MKTKGMKLPRGVPLEFSLVLWRWKKHELIEVLWQLLKPRNSPEALALVEEIKDKLDNESK